jgi:uncharacterized membrane protein YfcA
MMLDSWLSLPAGILIATAVSTVGIGGGILWMPFLLIILRCRPDTAVVTSLLIQTAGMGSGTVAFWRMQQIDTRLTAFLLILTIPGLILGSMITHILSPDHLELILGILTLTTAIIFVSATERFSRGSRRRTEVKEGLRYGWIVSIMAVASGMLSISVGEWLVPLLRNKLSLPMGVAVASSVATVFGACVLGAGAHLLQGGRADLHILLWAVPGVLLGGQIGPRIAGRINDRILKEVFIFLLTLIGIHLIYNSY